jgi:hypothetical protein
MHAAAARALPAAERMQAERMQASDTWDLSPCVCCSSSVFIRVSNTCMHAHAAGRQRGSSAPRLDSKAGELDNVGHERARVSLVQHLLDDRVHTLLEQVV